MASNGGTERPRPKFPLFDSGGVATFPSLSRELLVFLALFRQEIQAGEFEQPIMRWDLNRILENAVERYLNGERV